jgi:hypothetical protein
MGTAGSPSVHPRSSLWRFAIGVVHVFDVLAFRQELSAAAALPAFLAVDLGGDPFVRVEQAPEDVPHVSDDTTVVLSRGDGCI